MTPNARESHSMFISLLAQQNDAELDIVQAVKMYQAMCGIFGEDRFCEFVRTEYVRKFGTDE